MNENPEIVMTRFFTLLVLASLLFCDTTVAQDETLRVMSFNIRYGKANDGENHWRLRKETVVETIKNYAPDLLGTQETLKFQAEFLSANLKEYKSFGRSREKDPNQGEQCAIFYNPKRFEVVKKGQFWLSEKPEVVASKSWDSSLPRVATWIQVKDKQNDGREFVFLNTHFDHRGATARHESAKLIAKQLAAFELPFIVTGDFNCGEKSKPYLALVGQREINGIKLNVIDTYRNKFPAVESNEGTFNGFRGVDTGARIDWVLSSPEFQVVGAAIVKESIRKRFPSDHFPVTAELKLKK